jgi:aspartate 1-decarboxylase
MIEILQAKIHRAVVTDANINYEGSITISTDLMKLVGLCEYQKFLLLT